MPKKIFYGWWVVASCFIIAFYVSCVVFYGFTAFFEPLIKEFGWSYTQVSFAASLRGMEMGILSPLVGFLVDRYGSRKLLLAGIITVGIGLILLGMTQSLIMFYGAFVILAFGAGGSTSVVTMTAVANWFHKNAGKAFGIMASGFGASGLLIPIIVWLVDNYGWRHAIITLGVVMWIIGIPLCYIIRDKPEGMGLLPDGESFVENVRSKGEKEEKPGISFREAFRDRAFLNLNISEFVRMMVLSAVVVHVMPYTTGLGITRTMAGLAAAAVPLLSILGRFGFGWMGDIIDKRYVLMSSFSLMSLGLFVFSKAHSLAAIILFLLLFSPGYGGGMVMRGSILREYYGRDFFGKLIGIVMGFGSLGGIIGPTLAGFAFDKTGDYRMVWLSFSLCTLATIILAFYMKRERDSL